MTLSRFFTLASAIRLTVFMGLVAVFLVFVQSCQKPKSGLERFATGSLKRLTVLPNAPSQPNTEFVTVGGQKMRLSDYKGQILLVNIWATWCAPCIVEMPTLAALQDKRGGTDFQVLTVSVDRDISEPAAWMMENKIDLTPWWDNSFTIQPKTETRGYPTTLLYDRSGREIARVTGEADWASSDVLTLIDHLTETR